VHPGPGYKRVAPCFNARNARRFYILLRWSSAALPGFASGRSGSATSAFQGSNRSHPVAPCAAGSSARNHSAASTHRDVRRLAVSALNGRSLDRRSQSCDVIACGGAGLAGLLGAVLRNQNSRRPKERSDNNAASTRALSAHRQIFRVMTPLATSLVALFHIRPGLRCRPLARNGHGAMSAVSPPSESGKLDFGAVRSASEFAGLLALVLRVALAQQMQFDRSKQREFNGLAGGVRIADPVHRRAAGLTDAAGGLSFNLVDADRYRRRGCRPRRSRRPSRSCRRSRSRSRCVWTAGPLV